MPTPMVAGGIRCDRKGARYSGDCVHSNVTLPLDYLDPAWFFKFNPFSLEILHAWAPSNSKSLEGLCISDMEGY